LVSHSNGGVQLGRPVTIALASSEQAAQTPRQMSLCLSDGKRVAFRTVIAAGSIAAVLLAVVLSAIPQLHEQIHDGFGGPNHECAVTLLASGNCQHTPQATICLAPPAPPKLFVALQASFSLVSAHLEFSLLEHAPPANS
jgi:hypothetical protein